MRRYRIYSVFVVVCAFVTVSAGQTLKADYQFNGNLNSSVAGAPALNNLTGSGANSFVTDVVDGYQRQVLRFPFNSGLSLNTLGLVPNDTYTFVGLFKFDEVSGYRRLAGSDPNDDGGAYVLDGRLEFESTANAPFRPNHYIQIAVVREPNGTVRAYRDGGLRVTATDIFGDFILLGVLRMFQDDTNPPTEASAGNIARLRVYDGALSTTQIRALDRVPNATGGGDQPLLFWSGRDGNSEIYSMNVDGTNQKRLTNNEVQESGARKSPDGQKIVYFRRETPTAPFQIWTMNADGTNQVRITNTTTNDQNAAWAPNGQKILFSRCDAQFLCDLFTMNPDGSGQMPLTAANTANDEDNGSYSRDGTKIVFLCFEGGASFTNANVCTANSDGSGRVRVTNTVSPVFNGNPNFSPDGTQIAFERRTSSSSILTSDIYRMNSDGTNVVRLTNNSIADLNPLWSPDGQRIAFSSEPEAAFVEGYTMSAVNGTDLQRLTTNSIADHITDWFSPVQDADALFDFDGDGRTDISIFRPGPGQWWYLRSSDEASRAFTFGTASDTLSAADYTGDGKTDIGFWRPSTGEWYVLRSEDSTFYAFPFGTNGDVPSPADYDGDGKADATIFRPSNSTWYILQSSNSTTSIVPFGAAGDRPVPADYDGDGKADVAIFRPGPGQWWYLRSSDGGNRAFTFGSSTDKTVPGDYTGDGKADLAFWRPSTGEWYILRSEDSSFYAFPFGASTDIPSPGDYDGDSKTDAAVFRPSDTNWYVQRSTAGILIRQFGTAGDMSVPNSYVR